MTDEHTTPNPLPALTEQLQQEINGLAAELGGLVQNRDAIVLDHERQIASIDQQTSHVKARLTSLATTLNEIRKRNP